MQARGYGGELLTLAPHVMQRRDWLALMAGLVMVAALLAVGRLI